MSVVGMAAHLRHGSEVWVLSGVALATTRKAQSLAARSASNALSKSASRRCSVDR